VIRLESVTKRYGDRLAVDELDLEVRDGEVCVLIGPSGCGKTTTLRMINRLIEPTSGRILIDDDDVADIKPEELRRRLGYVIQSVGLFPHLTVEANIGVVPRLLHWGKERMHDRAVELLRLVGLAPDEYLEKYPSELSGGEAQRVGVARALAADPPVLLMDEPFGAVDPLNRVRLQDEFVRIQQDLRKTVILVTHDIDEAIRLADRIAIMREGRLMQYDTPEEILDRPANKFVHDFVGADRALKRLVRMPVTDVMQSDPPSIPLDMLGTDIPPEARAARFLYLTDAEGRLAGWVDLEDLEDDMDPAEAITHVDPGDSSVTTDASLKEALSRMIGLGFRSIAVVDRGYRLVGEVSLAAIEETMQDSSAHITNIEPGPSIGADPGAGTGAPSAEQPEDDADA
jgi:osmoprotectant transport system ATP-binding protein